MAEAREPANRWPDDETGGVPHRQRWDPISSPEAPGAAARRSAPGDARADEPPAAVRTNATSLYVAASIALVAFMVLLLALIAWDGGVPTVVPASTVPEASDAGNATPTTRGGPA